MRLIKHPVLCNYYVTYRCNASCNFCDIWEKPSPYVTVENVKENLIDLKKLGVKVIDFTGGEPLLHQQLPTFLEIAKSLGFITTVTTNCLLYPKFAKKLKGKIDMLHFSLDATTEEEHNKSRGVKCFQHLQESIEIAHSLGEKPDVLFTVSDQNINELDDLYKEYVIEKKLFLILNPIFEYNSINPRNGLSEESLQKLKETGAKRNVFLNNAFLKLRKNGGNNIQTPVCKAGSSTIVISPENKLILPCYHLGLKELSINGKLSELYLHKKTQDMIALEGRHEKCEGCVINCYMQPSFSVEMNKYWWYSLPSTLKYNFAKGTWKKLFKHSN